MKMFAAYRGAAGLAGFCLALACSAHAERVTEAEAKEAAQGWISTIIQIKGQWGPFPRAQVDDVRPMTRGNRVVGYFCPVRPGGYVVVSLHRELAPVRAYAVTGTLDPEADVGMSGFIRDKLEGLLSQLERRLGPLDRADPAQFLSVVQGDYKGVWTALQQAVPHDHQGPTPKGGPGPLSGYAGGRVLLATAWNQTPLYNGLCPNLGCVSNSNQRALVGCVPLAAAQLMRHWCWPLYGSQGQNGPYDWTQMPEVLTPGSSAAQLDNVTRLCHDAGNSSGADYGCDGTSGHLSCWWAGCRSMEDAYKDTFRYVCTTSQDRSQVSAQAWFDTIKFELNSHQPIQYGIPDHSVVVDGWQELQMGDPPATVNQYHVNYGWGGQHNGWFTVDEIPGGDPGSEMRLANLQPNRSLGPSPAGDIAVDPSFGYRYVNEDALGIGVVKFAAGQLVQFLPGAKIIGSGPVAQAVVFAGEANLQTRLFANGDPSRGILIGSGGVKLSNGGEVSVSPLVPPRFLSVAVGNHSVGLSWESGYTDDDAVLVERRTQPSPDWEVVGTVPEPTTAYTDGDVLPNNVYTYRVRASGHGALSVATPEIILRTPVW